MAGGFCCLGILTAEHKTHTLGSGKELRQGLFIGWGTLDP